MPPKKQTTHQISTRRPKTDQQHIPIIPIYESLKNSEIADPIVDLTIRIESSFKENPQIVKRSILMMLIKCCGLDDYALDFNFDQSLQSLENILERSYDVKLPMNSEPLIIHSKSALHNQFIKRVKGLFQVLISDDLNIVFDQSIQLLPSVLAWLSILSKSKMRITRSCAMRFMKYFIEEELKYFNYLNAQKQSKKAFVISKNVSYFLQQVLGQRINDVDSGIRETSINLIKLMFIQVENQLLLQKTLKKLINNSLSQKSKVLQSILQLILYLLQNAKNKKEILLYTMRHLQDLQELSINSNYNGVLSFKILVQINKFQPRFQSLKVLTIKRIFENYSQEKYTTGLALAVQVFLHSLCPVDQEIQMNSTIILSQILHLLSQIKNSKSTKIILRQFFIHNKKKADAIFSFQGMFNLLLSQSYRINSQDVRLTKFQLDNLAKTICQYAEFCQERYKQNTSEKQNYLDCLQTYNSLLLTASKQLFFQKIQNKNYQEICHSYLRMFSAVHLPIMGPLQSYIDFILERVHNMFGQTYGNEQVYSQIVNIYSKFEVSNIKRLVQTLQIDQAHDQIITKQNVFKISAIMSKYNLHNLLTPQVLNLYLNTFKQASQSSISIKLQIMKILKLFIQKVFQNLIQNPTHSLANFYKFSRDKIIYFLTQVISIDKNLIIKLGCFKVLMKIIQFVCNSKFQQANPSMVFELDQKTFEAIYDFVDFHIKFYDRKQAEDHDISDLMLGLCLQNAQIKEEMVKNLFVTYSSSYTFAAHRTSVRFIIFLLTKQAELMEQNVHNISFQYVQGFQKKTITNYINELLTKYSYEQSLNKNMNKFIFWRLCGQLLNESYQAAEHDTILHKIVTIYFKKKLQPENHKNLLHKLILFLITSVEKLLSKDQYKKIDIYQNILKKCYRKYDKPVLFRFKQYVSQKIMSMGIDDPYLNDFVAYLSDISKAAKDKKTKNKMENENQAEQESQNDQNNQNVNKEPQMKQKQKKEQKNKMEIQHAQNNSRILNNDGPSFQKRVTRNSMKKHINSRN